MKARRFAAAVAVAVATGCSSHGNASKAAFYRRWACTDWAAVISGVEGHTMTADDIARHLTLMADNAYLAARSDRTLSGWTDAVMRLRVDLLTDNTTTETADIAAVGQPCA